MELEEIVEYATKLIDSNMSKYSNDLGQNDSQIYAWLMAQTRIWAENHPDDPRVIEAKRLLGMRS